MTGKYDSKFDLFLLGEQYSAIFYVFSFDGVKTPYTDGQSHKAVQEGKQRALLAVLNI